MPINSQITSLVDPPHPSLNARSYDPKHNVNDTSYQLMAMRALSKQLTRVLNFNEVLDILNMYLWEQLNYSVATFVIHDPTDYRLEVRSYLKQPVSSNDIERITTRLFQYLKENSEEVSQDVLAVTGKEVRPLSFGVRIDESVKKETRSIVVEPIKINGKIIGVLDLSTLEDTEQPSDGLNEVVGAFLDIVSIAIARIHLLIKSLNSVTDSLIQNLSDGVVLLDQYKNVTLVNRSVLLCTELARDTVNMGSLKKVFGKGIEGKIQKTLETGKIQHVKQVPHNDRICEIYYVPVKDLKSRTVGCALVIRDITHLVAVDKAKTEFVSLASHQLRMPLSSIRWHAELLLESSGGFTRDQLESLNYIYESSVSMIALINSLLDISRLELGTFSVSPTIVDPTEICSTIIRDFSEKIRDKKLIVEEDYDRNVTPISIDPDLTRILISNLFSNAVKYSEIGGHITVTVKQSIEFLEISVIDSGIGIPADQQKFLFTKLFRADNARERKIDGTGLGLYITKNILHSVGGNISFKSSKGKGSTFIINLPLKGMLPRKGQTVLGK